MKKSTPMPGSEEIDAEKGVRLAIMRTGVQMVTELLRSHYGTDFNVVLAACPAGEREVSLISRGESNDAIDGIMGVIAKAYAKSQHEGPLQ